MIFSKNTEDVEVILLDDEILNSIVGVGETVAGMDSEAETEGKCFFTSGTDGAGKLLGRTAVIGLDEEASFEKESFDFSTSSIS